MKESSIRDTYLTCLKKLNYCNRKIPKISYNICDLQLIIAIKHVWISYDRQTSI